MHSIVWYRRLTHLLANRMTYVDCRWSHDHVARVEQLCSLLLCPRGVWCSQHGTAASAAGSSDADALELEWLEPSTPIGPLDNAGDNDEAGANVIALK